MGFKKNLEELLREPSEMSFAKVQNVLFHYGFLLNRIRGSHFTFKHKLYGAKTIPCHHNQVKRHYLIRIKDTIISKYNHD